MKSTYRLSDLPANMQNKIRVTDTGCWEWTGAKNSVGYGCASFAGVVQLTHRISYACFIGPIPKGLQVDHLCRMILCCNPAHLEAVTQQVNASRRPDAGKSHCVKGHALTASNLIIKRRAGGKEQRNCRECERQAQRRRRAERAAVSI